MENYNIFNKVSLISSKIIASLTVNLEFITPLIEKHYLLKQKQASKFCFACLLA